MLGARTIKKFSKWTNKWSSMLIRWTIPLLPQSRKLRKKKHNFWYLFLCGVGKRKMNLFIIKRVVLIFFMKQRNKEQWDTCRKNFCYDAYPWFCWILFSLLETICLLLFKNKSKHSHSRSYLLNFFLNY